MLNSVTGLAQFGLAALRRPETQNSQAALQMGDAILTKARQAAPEDSVEAEFAQTAQILSRRMGTEEMRSQAMETAFAVLSGACTDPMTQVIADMGLKAAEGKVPAERAGVQHQALQFIDAQSEGVPKTIAAMTVHRYEETSKSRMSSQDGAMKIYGELADFQGLALAQLREA